jgi:hypothetical protein
VIACDVAFLPKALAQELRRRGAHCYIDQREVALPILPAEILPPPLHGFRPGQIAEARCSETLFAASVRHVDDRVVAPFQYGFSAGPGYDLVTGLGSLNANDFFTNWGWVTGDAHLTTITTVSATTAQGAAQEVTPGSAVTFTVTVNALAGVPTGNVSLVSGSASLASAPLINGAATVTLVPALGPYSISANYAGDGTFLPSTSAPLSLFAADFSLSTNTTSFALNRGGSISIPVTITPSMSNYNPTVTLGCYGLPSEATCTFTPSKLAPVGGPAVATLLVATTAPNSAHQVEHPRWLTTVCALLFPCLGGLLWIGGSHRSISARTRLSVLLILLSCSSLWWTACGGGSRDATGSGFVPDRLHSVQRNGKHRRGKSYLSYNDADHESPVGMLPLQQQQRIRRPAGCATRHRSRKFSRP